MELGSLERKERASAISGLDIHSCLQFLLEQFEQFLSPSASPRVALMQLNETVKSVCTSYTAQLAATPKRCVVVETCGFPNEEGGGKHISICRVAHCKR